MKLIPLHDGEETVIAFALVDDADYDFLMQWKWNLHRGYARRTDHKTNESPRMHRVLINPPIEYHVDHINGNSLDNRRSNLRICTHNQNCYNRKKATGRASQYKGVTWNKRNNKWQAQLTLNKKMHYLGLFTSEPAAARAYDAAARQHFGEFARLNFPESE